MLAKRKYEHSFLCMIGPGAMIHSLCLSAMAAIMVETVLPKMTTLFPSGAVMGLIMQAKVRSRDSLKHLLSQCEKVLSAHKKLSSLTLSVPMETSLYVILSCFVGVST